MESLLFYTLKSGGVLFLFYLCYQLLLKKETLFKHNRIFLLTGLIVSVILPLIYLSKTVLLELSAQEQIGNGILAIENVNNSFLSWTALLSFVYFLGVILFLYRLALEVFKLHGIIKNGVSDNKRDFLFIKSDDKISPFSFFKWIVYNPSLHSQKELDAILEHEKIHSKQKHSLDIVFMELFLCLQWFNPVAWLYRKSLKENLEFLADANVQKADITKKEYQYILLKQAVGHQNLSIVNPFFNSLIKKRIVMINQNPSSKSKALKSLIVIPFLALFLLSFNVKTRYQFDKTPQNNQIGEIIELIIDKETTDEQLLKMKTDLKKNAIDFSYTTVRNEKGQIKSLSIAVTGGSKDSGEFSSRHSSESDNDTIDPTFIVIDKDNNSVSIGNGSKVILEEQNNSKVWMHKSGDDSDKKEIIIQKINGKEKIIINGKEATKEEMEEMDIDIEENSFIFIHNDDDEHTDKKTVIRETKPGATKHVYIHSDSNSDHDIEIVEKEGSGFFFLNTSSGEKPLLFIDGKKSTAKDVEELDKSIIKSVNVSKGSDAIKKYGEKAENGAVEIITKQN